jgi:hypothetical protein
LLLEALRRVWCKERDALFTEASVGGHTGGDLASVSQVLRPDDLEVVVVPGLKREPSSEDANAGGTQGEASRSLTKKEMTYGGPYSCRQPSGDRQETKDEEDYRRRTKAARDQRSENGGKEGADGDMKHGRAQGVGR